MKKLGFLVLLLAFVGMFSDLNAQVRNKLFYLSGGIGATNYEGDLDDNLFPKFTKPGFGIFGGYKFHPHMSFRLGFQQGWMKASDARASSDLARSRRNLSFRTPISELSGVLVYEFFANSRRYKFRPKWSPLIYAGVAAFTFRPQAKYNGDWIDLQPLGTEGQFLPDCETCPKPYKLIQIAIPIGAGIRYKLTKNIDLAVEVGVRKCFTDYLDDVSGNYPPMDKMAELGSQYYILADRIDRELYPTGAGGNYNEVGLELGVNGIRGHQGFGQQDWYVMSNITMTYILDWVRCPKFR